MIKMSLLEDCGGSKIDCNRACLRFYLYFTGLKFELSAVLAAMKNSVKFLGKRQIRGSFLGKF